MQQGATLKSVQTLHQSQTCLAVMRPCMALHARTTWRFQLLDRIGKRQVTRSTSTLKGIGQLLEEACGHRLIDTVLLRPVLG